MNLFGELGGFQIILDVLKKGFDELNEDINLTLFSLLLECVSKPYLIYQSEFQKEYAP